MLVIDQNFDLGGRMLHSGSFVSLGGGDPLQRRDTKGESDKEGFVTSPPVEDPAELDDDVELLFKDITDWSVLNRRGETPYRYNERELVRAWAENCPATRQFLIDNYVRFGRINGTHEGGGMSRARGAVCFLMLGDKTDIKAGTITAEDAGVADKERTSAFAPVQMNIASRFVGPNAVSNGVALARPLEFSAREKGVEFMLHRCFDELVREQPSAGRILGLKAHYSPRNHPETGELLQSYWRNGNIDERRETIMIRARKAVILASGGHAGNPEVRSMFYPAMREPAFPTSGDSLQGPQGQDASALIAGLRVGANLAGMQQNLGSAATFHISTRLGTRDAYTDMMPGHPTFGFRGSSGINVGSAGFEEFIAVNQVGKRFFNEVRLPIRGGGGQFPGGGVAPNNGIAHKPTDWRNCAARVGAADVPLRPWRRRGARDQRRVGGAALLLGTAMGDLRSGRGCACAVGASLSLRRGQRLFLQGRYDRGAGRQDRGGSQVSARAVEVFAGHRREVERLRRRRRRSRFRA